jgi:hypothetical protein
MTQIGEAVGLALYALSKPCPFCKSKETNPKFETLKLVNDSADLSASMGGMPKHLTENPGASGSYHIWENYWVSAVKSRICMNAHHVIPGNASLAKVPALQRWMAGTVIFEKKYYVKTKSTKGKGAHSFLTSIIPGTPSQKIAFKLDPIKGGANTRVTRLCTVLANLVTGKVDYDVNDALNGEWLPSNNAVCEWAKVSGLTATDCDGDSDNFAKCYSWNAMSATDRQFHDAHPDYSRAVRLELGALAKKVEKRAGRCKNNCPGSQAASQGSHPAPSNLKQALNDVSERIRPKLDTGKTTPKSPWVTSDLSIR